MVLRHGPLRPTRTSMAERACRQSRQPGTSHTSKTSSWDSSAYQTNKRCLPTSHREEQHASGHGEGSVTSKPSSRFKATFATTAAAEAMPVPETMEEERYVQVASRFFRVKPHGDGAAVASLHYLGSCFLCKESIACNRDVFMYKGDAAFCSDDCRQEQMAMDEALDAVARRHLLLRVPPSSPAAETPASSRPPVMRRRPTIANLAARNHPVAAS